MTSMPSLPLTQKILPHCLPLPSLPYLPACNRSFLQETQGLSAHTPLPLLRSPAFLLSSLSHVPYTKAPAALPLHPYSLNTSLTGWNAHQAAHNLNARLQIPTPAAHAPSLPAP